jgi:hypothetical protein
MPDRVRTAASARRARAHHTIDPGIQPPLSLYSDNHLDRADISAQAKLRFSEGFRARLRGERLSAGDDREAALWMLVTLIEDQCPRVRYSQVFDCLLAIDRAQEESIAQISRGDSCGHDEVLRMSCAEGGSSVLADACLTRGWLNEEERRSRSLRLP